MSSGGPPSGGGGKKMASTGCGEVSEMKNIDNDVLGICEKLRSQIEGRMGKKCKIFFPLLYRSQVVNGIIYYVKILIDSGESGTMLNECIHVEVYQSNLSEVTKGKTVLDKL